MVFHDLGGKSCSTNTTRIRETRGEKSGSTYITRTRETQTGQIDVLRSWYSIEGMR